MNCWHRSDPSHECFTLFKINLGHAIASLLVEILTHKCRVKKRATNLTLDLSSAFSFQDGIISVQQKLSEMVDLVTFPVINPALKFCHGGNAVFFVEGIISTMKD